MEVLYQRYVGGVFKRPTGYLFAHGSVGQPTYHKKHFSAKQFGSKQKAKEEAELYQIQYSELNDLTERYCTSTADEAIRRYLIGFAEGDGCITVDHTGRLKVLVTQVQNNGTPQILELFQQVYAGKISNPRHHAGWRNKYEWICNGFASLPVLKDWIQFGTLKRDQANIVFDFMTSNKTSNCVPIYLQLKAAKDPNAYLSVEIDDSVITAPYIAGLFDAEGTIGCYVGTTFKICFAQKNSINLLNSINNFFEDQGHIDYKNGKLSFSGTKAHCVLLYLLPYLIGKKEQTQIGLEIRMYICPHGHTHSKETKERLQFLRERLKMLKHQ